MGNLKLAVAKDATPTAASLLAEKEQQFFKLQSLMRQKANLSKLVDDVKAYNDRVDEITAGQEKEALRVTFNSGFRSIEFSLTNEALIKLLSEYLADISTTKLDLLNEQIANFSI